MLNANSNPAAPRLLRLAASDNVAVATRACEAGAMMSIDGGAVGGAIRLLDSIAMGHKVALRDIAAGEKILKFGCPIGSATHPILAGQHVHVHNLKSDYLPTFTLDPNSSSSKIQPERR